jgi:hypothetical protein
MAAMAYVSENEIAPAGGNGGAEKRKYQRKRHQPVSADEEMAKNIWQSINNVNNNNNGDQ